MKNRAENRKKLRKILIIFFWLAVWQLLALYFHSPILLASPMDVFRELKADVVTAAFWQTAGNSFFHILVGFLAAFLAALVTGIGAARFSFIEELLSPLMQLVKAVPVASFVVLLLIWAGSEWLSVWVTFLMVLPVIFQNVLSGIKHTDKELLEMAKVFEMPLRNRIRFLYGPALMPFLISGCKAALGMSWKAGVAAEVIGTPDFSIGERIYMSKIYLNTAGLFSWTFVVILLSFLFEKSFLFLLKKAAEINKKPVRKRESAGKNGMTEQTSDICLEQVDKYYGEQPVLQNFSMTLKAGGSYCIMGKSGGGKTTLLRILLDLTDYNKGRAEKPKGNIAAVFQEDRLCMEENAVTNVAMVCPKSVSEEEIRECLETVLPKEELGKKVCEFSGGMRRRVAIVRAMLSKASWIVMDEPFTGLDAKTREKMTKFILQQKGNRTLLVSTHQESDVEALEAELIKLCKM